MTPLHCLLASIFLLCYTFLIMRGSEDACDYKKTLLAYIPAICIGILFICISLSCAALLMQLHQ